MVSGEVESQFNLITSGNAHKFISKLGSNLADWEQSKWRKILKGEFLMAMESVLVYG